MTLPKAPVVKITLGVMLTALASMNIALSNHLVENYTPFGDPVFVTDDIETTASERATVMKAWTAGEPDGLDDYAGDFRWPEPSRESGGHDIVQTETEGSN